MSVKTPTVRNFIIRRLREKWKFEYKFPAIFSEGKLYIVDGAFDDNLLKNLKTSKEKNNMILDWLKNEVRFLLKNPKIIVGCAEAVNDNAVNFRVIEKKYNLYIMPENIVIFT